MFTVRPIEQGRPLAVSRAALLARAIATSSSRTGKHGRPSKCTLFNAPPQPSKAATAIWRGCITSSGACPNGATRCGQPCITSTFVLRMARHQPHAFSSTRSLTSLKQCVPMSALYLSPGNGNASLCSGIDVMKLSRLKPTVSPLLTPVASRNLLLYQSLPIRIPYRQAKVRRRKDDTSVGAALGRTAT
jgi:hypothetical protein